MRVVSYIIFVRNVDVEGVKSVLEDLGIDEGFSGETHRAPLDLIVRVDDYTQEFRYTDEFMAAHGLEENSEALRSLDLVGFNTCVELQCEYNGLFHSALDPFVDRLAHVISERMKTGTVVFLDGDYDKPFTVFQDGARKRVFFGGDGEYFKARSWKPSFL
jgi:hypothetical protein